MPEPENQRDHHDHDGQLDRVPDVLQQQGIAAEHPFVVPETGPAVTLRVVGVPVSEGNDQRRYEWQLRDDDGEQHRRQQRATTNPRLFPRPPLGVQHRGIIGARYCPFLFGDGHVGTILLADLARFIGHFSTRASRRWVGARRSTRRAPVGVTCSSRPPGWPVIDPDPARHRRCRCRPGPPRAARSPCRRDR